ALNRTIKLCTQLGHDINEISLDISAEQYAQSIIQLSTAPMYKEIKEIAKEKQLENFKSLLEPVVLSAYNYSKNITTLELLKSIELQNKITRKLANLFLQYDVILTPSLAQLPLKHGELSTNQKGLDVLQWFDQLDAFVGFQDLY